MLALLLEQQVEQQEVLSVVQWVLGVVAILSEKDW